MKREEAIEVIRKCWPVNRDGLLSDAIKTLIPEFRESEDERIRKALIHIVKGACDKYGIKYKGDEITEEKLLAYLEKKKDHQNNYDATNESSWEGAISSSDNGRNLDELAREYIDGVKQYHPTPTWDLMQIAVCYGYHLGEEVGSEGVESVKPAEWSEEDEKMWKKTQKHLEDYIREFDPYHSKQGRDVGACLSWLKSLRPSWKPSEEQLDAVRYVSQFDYGGHKAILVSLYEQLKKLI